MSFSLELAQRITAVRYEDLPSDAVSWAKVGILDTVGVTLAGHSDPSAQIVAHALAAASGPALVFGSVERVGALDAALINGTASHALDFDDVNNTLGGHPSAPILPALFALAEQTGAGNYDAARILPAWGKPWDIVEPGIAIKQYPCCGSTHPAIDAMLMLVREHNLKPEQVERIDSWTHKRRLEHTNRPDPQSTFDAKFSVQYCLARALADRKVVLAHFDGDTYRDKKIRDLLPRIHVAPYTTAQFPADNHFGAEVKVALRDGTVHAQKVDQPFGRTSANPLPPELLKEKFVNCALRVLPEASVTQLHAAIQELERLDDMRQLTALICPQQKIAKRIKAV